MNMKTTKFLAVLAIMAFAFAMVAVSLDTTQTEATTTTETEAGWTIDGTESQTITKLTAGTATDSLTLTSGILVFDKSLYATTTNLTIANSNNAIAIYMGPSMTVVLPETSGAITLGAYKTLGTKTVTSLEKLVFTVTDGTNDAKITATTDAEGNLAITSDQTTAVVAITGESKIVQDAKLTIGDATTIFKVNVTAKITNDGTIVNKMKDQDADASTLVGQKQLIIATSGSIVASSGKTGSITGQGSYLVEMTAGELKNQIIHAADYTPSLDSVLGIFGNVTVEDIVVYVPEGGHGITMYAGTATATLSGIEFRAEGNKAVTVESVLGLGVAATNVTITGITVDSNISYRNGYALFNLFNAANSVGKVNGTSSTVYIDSSVTSIRVAGTAGSDVTLNDSFTFDKIVLKHDNHSVIVSAGKTLTADVEFVGTNGSISLTGDASAGAAYIGTITNSDASADLCLQAGTSALTIAQGSIVITGSIDSSFPGSAIVQTAGDVKLGAITITPSDYTGLVNLGGEIDITDDITIADGSTVYTMEDSIVKIANDKKITVDEGAILSVDGTVKAATTGGTGAIVNNGTLKESVNATVTAAVSGTGTVVEESDMEEIEVSGTSIQHTTYPSFQTVIVKDSWTLGTGKTTETCAYITITGKLIIPAGATLTVKSGAVLVIDGAAEFIIEGTLVIEGEDTVEGITFRPGYVAIINGYMSVEGSVSNNGIININDSMEAVIEPLGSFVVEDSGMVRTGSAAKFTVSAGAELKIKGSLGSSEIYNFGYILIDSEYPARSMSTIYQLYDGATVEIKEFTIDAIAYNVAGLTISDYGMLLIDFRYDGKEYEYYRNTDSEALVIRMGQLSTDITSAGQYAVSFSGITVTSNVTTTVATKEFNEAERIYNYEKYDKEMDIQGNLNVSYTYIGQSSGETTYVPTASVEANGEALVVTEDMDIYDGVTFTVLGKLTVTGDIDTSSDKAKFAADADASVTVKGEGSISSTGASVTSETGMNAAKVVIPITDLTGKIVKIYTYLSIDSALDLMNTDGTTVTEVVLLGKQTLTASNYVDADDTLVVNGTLTIGKTGTTDVVLTVKTGAKLKGTGSIAVNGTLYAENKTNVNITASKISSDVYACELNESGKEVGNGWAMWTNISTAIAEAEIGETVTLKQDATLYSNLTIPGYVIVDVPNGKILTLDDGVTLTVDGVLMIEGDVQAQTGFDLTAKKIEGTAYSSTIIVNGALMSTGDLDYVNGTYGTSSGNGKSIANGAPIAGAYYGINKYKVISDLSDALANVDAIIENIVLNGKIVEGDLVFEATKKCVKITLSGAEVKDGSNNKIVNSLTVGSLTLADGASFVIDAGAYNSNAAYSNNNVFTGKVIIDETQVSITGLTTNNKNVEFKANTSEIFSISGAASITDKGDAITVDAGILNLKGLTVAQATKGNDYDYTTTFVISSDAIVNADAAADNKIVNMTVNGILYVPAGKQMEVTNITVYGAVTVENATTTAPKGELTIDTLAYVGMTKPKSTSAAATLSGPFTPGDELIMYVYADTVIDDACQAVLDDMKSTALYVEGELWFTLYGGANATTVTVSTTPVENTELNGWATSATGTSTTKVITIGSSAKVYADINYNIYGVTIYTDAGVKSVSIDGIELMNDQTNVFKTVVGLVAGTHTVSYTMKEGYEGTPTLATMTGTVLKDNKFATSGTTDAEKKLSFQLMGTEPQPEPEPVTPEEKSEWTVTTILLCVLVVLIAIMAVIVALRLNRN